MAFWYGLLVERGLDLLLCPPPPSRRLLLRTVRILLESILVMYYLSFKGSILAGRVMSRYHGIYQEMAPCINKRHKTIDRDSVRIFTVRKRSCGKVMLLHLSVSHSVHRRGGGSVWGGCVCVYPSMHWADTTPLPDGHCSGRYASYWNVYLYFITTT